MTSRAAHRPFQMNYLIRLRARSSIVLEMIIRRDRISTFPVLLLILILFLSHNFTLGTVGASDHLESKKLASVDPYLTSPSGTYRWLDVADQAYSSDYRNSYNYLQATVEVTFDNVGEFLGGTLIASNLKPNFAYQLKLVGTPGTDDNERIGLRGRWWQEVWDGSAWSNGWNLNTKGDGSSPNPNDVIYFERRYQEDSSSPTGYHYRYTGYLPFEYFITDSNGDASLEFETGSCYHVLWKTSQRSHTADDGPIKTVTFDPDPVETAYDENYPNNTVSVFGEWERLPLGGVDLLPGEYSCQIVLTEESFHGSGGEYAGNWADAMSANITFTIMNTSSRSIVYDDETNTIICTGGTKANPITFWDLWNASDTNMWNVSSQTCQNTTIGLGKQDTQFLFGCKIQIGDGGTETYFNDTQVHVYFIDQNLNWNTAPLIDVKAKATFTLGRLIDPVDRTTCNGCALRMDNSLAWPSFIHGRANSKICLYASLFASDQPNGAALIKAEGGGYVYGCTLIRKVMFNRFHGAFYRVNVFYSSSGIERSVITFLDDFFVTEQWNPSNEGAAINEFSKAGTTIYSNVKIRNCQFTFRAENSAGDTFLIDTDTDAWILYFKNSPTLTMYRQYTFNLYVVNATGYPIENATCILYNNTNGVVFNVTTNESGVIIEQIVSRGHYNQTGANSLYDYGPFKLTVVKGGMSEIIANITLADSVDWIVSLEEACGGVPSTIGLALTVCSALVGMAVVLTRKHALACP